MSVQIALGAPATRVASRKLGPVAGNRSRPASSASAASETSTFASTCGRCETVARIVSCVSGSIAAGRAPRPTSRRCRRSYSIAGGDRGRSQVPGRAVEQVGTGMIDPGVLRAGERVPADEPRLRVRRDDRPLGRADVGHDTVRRGGSRAPRRQPRAAAGPEPRRTRPRRRRRSASVLRRGRSAACGAACAALARVKPARRLERTGRERDRAADRPGRRPSALSGARERPTERRQPRVPRTGRTQQRCGARRGDAALDRRLCGAATTGAAPSPRRPAHRVPRPSTPSRGSRR